MAETTNINIRVDKELKDQATALFESLGLTLTGGINVFLSQSVREGKIPFEITLREDEK